MRVAFVDRFEESLRQMLKDAPPSHDDDAALGRVLKTANRRVGAGDLFTLLGRWVPAVMLAIDKGSPHLAPVSRRAVSTSTSKKTD